MSAPVADRRSASWARDADRGHASGLGCRDSGGGVLHDDRRLGPGPEFAGCGEEHLGLGLAMGEVPARNVGVEEVQQGRARPQRR
jgi:hypothetical protein